MFTLLLLSLIFCIFLFIYIFWRPAQILHFGCRWTRWGCCRDNLTPKLDQSGSNCVWTPILNDTLPHSRT